MKLIAITQADLKSIHKLIKKQDNLASEVKELNASLARLERSIGKITSRSAVKTSGLGTMKVSLDEKIEKGLKRAGIKGITLPRLAEKTSAHLPSVRTWFATKAKKLKNVKRISRGRYCWVGK